MSYEFIVMSYAQGNHDMHKQNDCSDKLLTSEVVVDEGGCC